MDIIYNIMRDAAELEGVCAVLQHLINIAAERSATCECHSCAFLGTQLAMDLDAAKLRFEKCIEAHQTSKAYV